MHWVLRGIVVFWCLALGAASAQEEQVDALEAKRRVAPAYPSACAPPEGEFIGPQTVTLGYDVNSYGLVENVRILESTHSCFNEAAINAVRRWLYERNSKRSNLETTFTFILHEDTQVVDFDARLIYRPAIKYPRKCIRHSENEERVGLYYDVSADGVPENIEIIESSNSCFNTPALIAAQLWRYQPKTVNGKPVVRKGVMTHITFSITGRGNPETVMRRRVAYPLERVRSLIKQGKLEKAQEMLADLETKYGDTFSHAELSRFLRYRANLKTELKDYEGALSDLLTVQALGVTARASVTVGNAILELEALVAQQEDIIDSEERNSTESPSEG